MNVVFLLHKINKCCNPSYLERKIRRIKVRSQPRQIVWETLSPKKKAHYKKRAGGVTQSVEFNPQYQNKQTNKQKEMV
jgi:hypothetical protein